MTNISVFCDDNSLLNVAQKITSELCVELNVNIQSEFTLMFSAGKVLLRHSENTKAGDIFVEFCSGGAAHRRRHGGGKGQMIAKAVGVTSHLKPQVFDATPGLGGDGFVLATLGCPVHMMERSPVAFSLLSNGLARALVVAEESDPELHEIVSRMALTQGDSITHLDSSPEDSMDVIYLDPMFPERAKKNAAVKKEMAAFHSIIGSDLDEEELLEAALRCARYRVVVKRPRIAPEIAGKKPNVCYAGKSSRFDVYTKKKML